MVDDASVERVRNMGEDLLIDGSGMCRLSSQYKQKICQSMFYVKPERRES